MSWLFNLLYALEKGAEILTCFMPATADKILKEIGAQGAEKALTAGYTVTNAPETLFERIKFEDIKPKIKAIEDAQKAEASPVETGSKAQITIDDFSKIEMRVGTVVACEAVKKSKLLHETIALGGKTLSVLSGIAKHYTPEEMVGKRVIVVCNLPPREMKGLKSEGMIVCAEAPDGTLSIVSPEKNLPDGSLLS